MRYRLCPVLLLCLCLAPLAVPGDAVVKIMPLGDSITRGDTWSSSPHPSYRYYLDDSLRAQGFAVDFVGSTSSAFSRFVFDQQHEGHGGYTTGMMAGSASSSPLAAWLAASPTPEIVLLHVGTNDALTGVPLATRLANVRSIVTILRQKNPTVRVLVAQIIPTANATFDAQSDLVAYNKALPGLAAGLSTPSSPVSVVDLYTGYSGVADNQADGIHPKTSGEKKMAAAWQRALVPVLSATPATTKPTTKPTTPAPSGRAVPATIEAEDYDAGGEGVGYHDTTPGNHDNVYRRDGVDLSVNPSGGYNVGYVADGEWLAYTLAVPSAGTYTVSCTVASWADGRSLGLSLDGASLGTLAVPNNRCIGWRTVSKQVALPAGSHRLVVRFGGDKQILDRIAIGAVATPTTTKPTAKPTITSTANGIPGTLEAEDYAAGGEGTAYHDTTRGNSGGAYRNDDVDVEAVPGGGHAVCYVRDGEWLRYTLSVANAGTYAASFRVAAWGAAAHAIEVSVNDRPAATVVVPSTGSYAAWTDATATLALPAGTSSLKLRFVGDGQNLDRVAFAPVSVTTVPTTKPTTKPTTSAPSGRAVPATIEAEDYDAGGEGVGYHDTTPGNHDNVYRRDGVDLSVNPSGGYNVGYVADGEWLAYTLAVPSAGTYTVSCTVASWADGRSLGLSLDGASLGTLAVPNNRCIGWRTVSKQVALPAGSHRLVVRFGGDKQILDRIAIGAVATPTTTKPTAKPTITSTANGIPGTLEAEDYAAGGEGTAYHDTTRGNSGGAYRNDDVDVEAVPGGGHAVCYVRDGEWLRYTLSVANAGTYAASFRVAAWGAAAHAIEVSVNDRPAATVAVPSTGSYDAWTDATATLALPAGTSSLKLRFAGDGQNLDNVVFTQVAATAVPTAKPTTKPTTPPPSGREVPGTIEAEDYDAGGEGAGYHDTTPGNHDNVYRRDGVDLSVNPSGGYNVGYVADGEWLAYTLAVPSAGTYTVSCTVASWADGRSLGLSLDGASLGTLAVPNNRCIGWRTVSKQVALPAGSHRLVVRFGGDKQILDRIAIGAIATPTTTKPTTKPTVTGGVRLPAQVQAEDYIAGGEGVAYHDTTPGNQGGAYRNDGVDIAYSSAAGSRVVTRIQPGEWLEYVVDAPQGRDYQLAFRLSSPSGGQFIDLKVDGRPEVMAITPRTGSYDAYTTISTQVRLARGSHRLRIQFSGAGQNFDSFGLS